MSLYNKRRIASAEAALKAYRKQGGADGDDLIDIGDLVVNLMHLAAERGEDDMRWFVERQLGHFIAESIEPDDIELASREEFENNAD